MMGVEFDNEEELERIRRRKAEELRQKYEEEQRRALEKAQKRVAIKQILTAKALERLDNIRVVRPELAEALEGQLILLVQSGRIRPPIDEDLLKQILESVYRQTRKEYRIRF